MENKESTLITVESIQDAANRLCKVVVNTPLQYSHNLSKKYDCEVYLKREDLQVVRSYKIRGAYNMMSSLNREHLQRGVVCASAGNHAQGFAYSCKLLGAKGVVFMPNVTPKQKVTQTKMFGEDWIQIRLEGDTFDHCAAKAKIYAKEHGMIFVPPFDHKEIIEGQGTVGLEILDELQDIDFLFVPVGGGGLAAGVGSYFKRISPTTKIIGVEPLGAPSMSCAMEAGHPVLLQSIKSFVDGAAVKRVGDITFEICKEVLHEMHLVSEGKVCSTILRLYNQDAIVVEPAGALSIAALDDYADQIKGKKIVCVVSGSNNDIDRIPEIKERSLQYEGLKHYFLVRFAQRPGALKDFLNKVLGPNDDISRFEYMKKNAKESGSALVGIELTFASDYDGLINRMKEYHMDFTEVNKNNALFEYLV
jgi:threonine dehydratase